MMENFPSSTKQQCSLLFSVLCTMYTVVVGLCPCFGNPQGKKKYVSREKKRSSSYFHFSLHFDFSLTFPSIRLQLHIYEIFLIYLCIILGQVELQKKTDFLFLADFFFYCCCCFLLMNNLNRLNSLSMDSFVTVLLIIKKLLVMLTSVTSADEEIVKIFRVFPLFLKRKFQTFLKKKFQL